MYIQQPLINQDDDGRQSLIYNLTGLQKRQYGEKRLMKIKSYAKWRILIIFLKIVATLIFIILHKEQAMSDLTVLLTISFGIFSQKIYINNLVNDVWMMIVNYVQMTKSNMLTQVNENLSNLTLFICPKFYSKTWLNEAKKEFTLLHRQKLFVKFSTYSHTFLTGFTLVLLILYREDYIQSTLGTAMLVIDILQILLSLILPFAASIVFYMFVLSYLIIVILFNITAMLIILSIMIAISPIILIVLYCSNKERIKAIKTSLAHEINYNKIEKINECPVCLEEFIQNDSIVPFPCHNSHMFHENCAFDWLKKNNTCPICRFEIKNKDKKDFAIYFWDSSQSELQQKIEQTIEEKELQELQSKSLCSLFCILYCEISKKQVRNSERFLRRLGNSQKGVLYMISIMLFYISNF